jgi:Lrp/AsnC family transcriptional regulator for asnA, asnC and gidA
LDELDNLKEKIRREASALDLNTCVMTGTRFMPENLSIGSAQKSTGKIDEPNVRSRGSIKKAAIKIDEIDEQILEKLAENGRVPFSKISEEIGVTTDTVIRRYRKLKENSIIKVSIQIDPTKLGYYAMISILVAFASGESAAAIVETVSKIPDVTNILTIAGDYDMHIFALVKDVKQMLALLNEIERARGMLRIETSIERLGQKYPAPRVPISTF